MVDTKDPNPTLTSKEASEMLHGAAVGGKASAIIGDAAVSTVEKAYQTHRTDPASIEALGIAQDLKNLIRHYPEAAKIEVEELKKDDHYTKEIALISQMMKEVGVEASASTGPATTGAKGKSTQEISK